MRGGDISGREGRGGSGKRRKRMRMKMKMDWKKGKKKIEKWEVLQCDVTNVSPS